MSRETDAAFAVIDKDLKELAAWRRVGEIIALVLEQSTSMVSAWEFDHASDPDRLYAELKQRLEACLALASKPPD